MCVYVFSCVWLSVTPWTVAHQVPPFMGFPSKNTGVGCNIPSSRIELKKKKKKDSQKLFKYSLDRENIDLQPKQFLK